LGKDQIIHIDEQYILDLCDAVLGLTGQHQHRFDFLRGDPGKNGKTIMLPVDIYYPSLNLVIEYHERQHTEDVPFFDKKMTVSGISRKEQRRRYDEIRRQVLPQHNITLIEFSYQDFDHDIRKRLKRNRDRDEVIIRNKLSRWLPK